MVEIATESPVALATRVKPITSKFVCKVPLAAAIVTLAGANYTK
jgi:hypothetical protein